MLTARMGGLVTAVTELKDKRLVMMLDVEKILSGTSNFDDSHLFANLAPLDKTNRTLLYADDSSVARSQIERTLQALGVTGIATMNGRHAWDELQKIASRAELSNRPVTDYIQVVLTDVEMPEMDGYVLTKNIKSDPALQRHPGADAFLIVVRCQPKHGSVGRRRRIRARNSSRIASPKCLNRCSNKPRSRR
jgi:two-component system chemotaxis response regulator CheV